MTTSFAKALGYGGAAGAIAHHNSGPAYLLKRSEQTLISMYLERSRAGRSRLTFSQLLLLCAIDAVPGAHQAVAARMAGMDTPTTTIVMQSLIRQRLVDRKSSRQDGRHRILTVTARGRAARRASLEHLTAAEETFVAPLRKRDRQRLLELLIAISGNPKSHAPPLCDPDGRSFVVPDYLPREVLTAFLISRCLQIAVSLVAPALAPFGLSIGQYVSLLVLATFEECNLAALGRALGRQRSSLSLILSALEARSLVGIDHQPRSLTIAPTQAGFELLLQARPAAEKANAQILSGLDRAEAQEFTRILAGALRYHGKLMSDGSKAHASGTPRARGASIKPVR